MDRVVAYFIAIGGLIAETAYLYISGNNWQNGHCHIAVNKSAGNVTARWECTTGRNATDVIANIAKIPVAVTVDTNGLQLYQSGIISGNKTCSQNYKHTVLSVDSSLNAGYNLSSSKAKASDYYSKNSWGRG